MTIIMSEIVQNLIKQHALLAGEEECCGLLLGKKPMSVSVFYPLLNIAKDKKSTYLGWPELMAHIYTEMPEVGLEIVGAYHSHPTSSLEPSKSDTMFAFFPELVYVICNKDGLKAWSIPYRDTFMEVNVQS